MGTWLTRGCHGQRGTAAIVRTASENRIPSFSLRYSARLRSVKEKPGQVAETLEDAIGVGGTQIDYIV